MTYHSLNLIKVSFILFFVLIIACGSSKKDPQLLPVKTHKNGHDVSKLKITTLSTMLSTKGIGEWGYAALVEVDGKKILFDTGRRSETVWKNAEELNIDLSDVEDVFLSHNHGDHTGGLLKLREEYKKINPKAFSKIHVGKGIFAQRLNVRNRMMEMKETLEKDGVEFFIYDESTELFPGVWITGPIERVHEEKNYGGRFKLVTPEGSIVDNIPESQSLVIDTEKGFVSISGCGHAGIVNTLEHIKTNISEEKVHAILGGFHLVVATDEHLKWTAAKLKEFGVSKINGAHCTGLHALYFLKEEMGLDRADAIVGSVGDSFDLENGLYPGIIAK